MKANAWDRARWAFGAGVLLLVLIGIAAGELLVKIQESNRRVMHAFTIQLSLQDLESGLAAAGRARTLYVSTRAADDLATFNERLATSAAQLKDILTLTSDIPAHHDSYAELAVLANRRMAILRASVASAQAGKTDAATEDAYTRQVVSVADDIKDELERLETHEQSFADQGRIVSERLFVQIVSVLAFAFLIAVLLLYLNFRFLLAELAERRRAEKSAIESKETLRLLSLRLIRSQDEQSRKFSRELHDSLGQSLSLAKMNISSYLRKSPPSEVLSETVELLDRSLAETRTISYLLHPPLLDDMGFVFAAKWYLEGYAKRGDIRLDVDLPEEMQRLPLAVEITLFRVLQECLTNIHRHSGSQQADVSLRVTDQAATLSVRDYGKGIPPEVLAAFRRAGGRVGVGLAGMRERVREQGGELNIQSGAEGTTVTVRIPVPTPAADAVTPALPSYAPPAPAD